MGRVPNKSKYDGQKDMGADETALLYEKIEESMWRAMEWACDEKENAVICYTWRSTTWWQSLHTRMMEEDPETTQGGSISGGSQSWECVG